MSCGTDCGGQAARLLVRRLAGIGSRARERGSRVDCCQRQRRSTRDYLALILPDVRQLQDACDVADRPQPLARAHVRVDRDSSGGWGDANGLEPDPLDTRAPSGRHEQTIPAQLPSILQSQDEVLALAGRRDRLHPEHELDSVPTQRLPQRLPQGRRLPRKHVLRRLDEHHLPAQTTHDLSKLDAGRPTSQHDQPSGHGLHPGRFVRAPDAVELSQAGDWRDDRIGAIGKDDLVGGVAHAFDLDHSCPGEATATATAQQRNPSVRQPLRGSGVGVVRDHDVAPIKRRLHLDFGRGGRLTRAVHRLPRAQQRLRWDARLVLQRSPTRSRSTTATRRPPSAIAAAQCSPGAPPPSTITS